MKMTCFLGFVALLVVVQWTSMVQTQTFQYSRGWTNGKRSGFALPWAELAEPKNGSSAEKVVAEEGDDDV